MNAPPVEVGANVAFVPSINHARDRDLRGEHVFAFEHCADGPMRQGAPMHKKGDTVHMSAVGSLKHEDGASRDPATGVIQTAAGYRIQPTRPLCSWKATILAMKPDGKADLRIQHPHGHILEYLDVPYSATNELHTWHLPEGA